MIKGVGEEPRFKPEPLEGGVTMFHVQLPLEIARNAETRLKSQDYSTGPGTTVKKLLRFNYGPSALGSQPTGEPEVGWKVPTTKNPSNFLRSHRAGQFAQKKEDLSAAHKLHKGEG